MKEKMMHPLFLSLLSGILIGFSYIPGPSPLTWIAFIPFFIILQSKLSTKKKVAYAWLTQFTLTLIGFHWIGHTISEFGRLPFYLGILGLFAFASFASLHFCISTLIYDKLFKTKSWKTLISFCLLFVLSEWFYPMIFPWHMGYSWAPSIFPIKQFADTIGFWGLGLLTLGMNLWLFYLWKAKAKFKIAAIGLASFLVLNLLGYVKQSLWSKPDMQIRFYVAQANIGNLFKYKAEKQGMYQKYIIDEYLNMTRSDLENESVDMIVWPETAMPIFMNLGRLDSHYTKQIADIARNNNAHIFTGVYSYKGEDIYNSIAMIGPDGIVKDLYSKHQLLAFGEYFPGTENNPKLKALIEKIVPAVSHFARGPGPKVFNYNNTIQIGPQVCYEGLDPLYVKGANDQGAHIFINVTNDSWFGQTYEPYQHMYMTFARAIEFRRPLLRSTNTGITSAITASGQILEMSKIGEKKGYFYTIPLYSKPSETLYAKSASLLPYFLLMIWLIFSYMIRKKED